MIDQAMSLKRLGFYLIPPTLAEIDNQAMILQATEIAIMIPANLAVFKSFHPNRANLTKLS